MHLQQSVQHVFVQLEQSLLSLTNEQYCQPCPSLFNASVGQHVRHIIELFLCLEKGYSAGTVNYEKRNRDTHIETSRDFAITLLHEIYSGIDRKDKQLMLEAGYDEHSDETMLISTNYYREVVYNLEHTVHHMALIRVGISEVSSVVLPENFGIASSTVKHRKTCAQ
ncbi:DinB family protein [Foetidibacter luteolus]|uniref:DinB family protein n=1 Tax=Foetidibacter luteolus TaxID=2608880 RepID=UPI00129A1986|nr:DinB family protein [Foetidibacter luteolus]